jgi:hypothetical protein
MNARKVIIRSAFPTVEVVGSFRQAAVGIAASAFEWPALGSEEERLGYGKTGRKVSSAKK